MRQSARLSRLGRQSSLEPRLSLGSVLAPLGSVALPVAVGGLLGALQAFEDLSHVDTLRGKVCGPGFANTLAPGSPFITGSLGGGESGEGGTIFGRDGLASDLGVVVVLPLGSVFAPGLGELVGTRNEREVGGGSGGLVLLGESLAPGLPGLVLELGVLDEDGGGFRRHR